LFCKKRKYAGSCGGKIDKIIIMKKYFFLWGVLFLFSCSSTKSSQNNYFANAKATHKVIAILPAVVQIHTKEKDSIKIPQEQLDEAALKLGFMIQNELYNRIQKNKYTVIIQPVKYTNDKLFAGGLSFNKYKTMSEVELAKILEVDAVIFCKTDLTKISYKNATIFLGLGSAGSFILGASLTALSAATAKEVQTDKVKLQVGIVEGKTGIEIWQTYYTNEPSSYYGLEDFFSKSLKNASKIIPYRK
jgi:hypothetical protein